MAIACTQTTKKLVGGLEAAGGQPEPSHRRHAPQKIGREVEVGRRPEGERELVQLVHGAGEGHDGDDS